MAPPPEWQAAAMVLTADDLLAGGESRHEVDVPAELCSHAALAGSVVLRPLTVRDLQRIGRAARDDDELAATLAIQQGLAEPALTVDQVGALPAGLARFLVERINEITGVSLDGGRMRELVHTPLARACYQLAKEFGWTPEEVSAMTVGQILMYLELSQREAS